MTGSPPPEKPQKRRRITRRRSKPAANDGRDKKESSNPDWVVNYLLIVSSIVWVTNFFFGVFVASYKGSETVNAVFMAVIGGIFTLKTKNKGSKDE